MPRASPLAGVVSGRQARPRRTFVYGVGGIGKSSWAASSDAPIFLDLEGGLDDIDCAKLSGMKTFDEVTAAIASLANEDHTYRTVVIDGVEVLEQMIWAETCARGDPQSGRKNLESIEAFPYGRGYQLAIPIWRWFLDSLDKLRTIRGMSVILVGHAKIQRFESPDTSNYDRYMPRLDKLAAALLMEWVDELFFATWKIFVHSETKKGKGKATGEGERILRTIEQPFAMAKNRLGLEVPDEIPLDWQEYAKLFLGAPKEEVKA